MNPARIESNLQDYLGRRTSTARYTSFDYCFNHFRSFHEARQLPTLLDGETLLLSCLHLAFYLASWGMLRGSSALLTRSVRHYVPVIEAIVRSPAVVWDIDAHEYSDHAIDSILGVRERLRAAFTDPSSDILITKVMLGVFGCVPAFDTQFKRGFDASTFGRGSLKRIGDFYTHNREVIERHRHSTIDFSTGCSTNRRYTRAKVIDMIFFIEGGRKSLEAAKESA